jgi:hypothetical protein
MPAACAAAVPLACQVFYMKFARNIFRTRVSGVRHSCMQARSICYEWLLQQR